MATRFDEAYLPLAPTEGATPDVAPVPVPAGVEVAPTPIPQAALQNFNPAEVAPLNIPVGGMPGGFTPVDVNNQGGLDQIALTSQRRAAEASNRALQRVAHRAAVMQHTGAGGVEGTDELTRDLAYRTDAELRAKYPNAEALIAARLSGQQEAIWRETSSRDTSQMLGDTALDAGNAFAQGFIGLGALAFSPVPAVGTRFAEVGKELNDWVQGLQSQGFQNRRGNIEARADLNSEQNTALTQQDIADGMNPVEAHLRGIGRGILDGVTDAASDSMNLTSLTGAGIGSMFSGGILGRAIRAAGGVLGSTTIGRALGIGAPTADRAMMAAIGAQEAGGVYQQTVNEIMAMETKDLEEHSPLYRELIAGGYSPDDARRRVANFAGQIGAAIQAPFAVATGRLVARFEANPLSVPSLRTAGRNIINETLEEGVQSGTGQIAQNIGQMLADNRRSISEGVGEQIGVGALGGALTAGAVQAPASGGRAARAIAGAAGDAVLRTAERVSNERRAATDAQSPVSEENISQEINSAREELAAAPTPSAPAETFSNELNTFVQQTNEAGENRITQLFADARASANQEATPEDRMDAALRMRDTINALSEIPNRHAQEIDSLPDDDQAVALYNRIDDGIAKILQNPAVTQALQMLEQRLAEQQTNAQSLTDENVNTPEGQRIIQGTLALAEMDPTKVNPQTLGSIANRVTSKGLVLTPRQQATLNATSAILETLKATSAEAKRLGVESKMRSVGDAVLSNQEAPRKEHQLSLVQHASAILSAASKGDRVRAKNALEDLAQFVRHMSNKVDAFNRSFGTGARESYQALGPNNAFYDSSRTGNYAQVHANANSVQLAQTVALEAQRVAEIYNALTKIMPDLGERMIQPAKLIKPLRVSTQQAIQNVSRKRGKQVAKRAQAPSSTTVTTALVVEEAQSQDEASTPPPVPPAPVEEPAQPEFQNHWDPSETHTAEGAQTPFTGVPELNEGQKAAAEKATAFLADPSTQAMVIDGPAGSGKTTLVNSLLNGVAKGKAVILSSPTHRANSVLRSRNPNRDVLTLAKLLGLAPGVNLEEFDAKDPKFQTKDNWENPLTSNTLLIIDESSMINPDLFKAIRAMTKEVPGAKIIFLGDSAQLGPVMRNTKPIMSPVFRLPNKASLTEVMRAQNSELLDESVHVRETGDFSNDTDMNNGSGVAFTNDTNAFFEKIIGLFKSDASQKNPMLARMLSYTNKRVADANALIREAIHGEEKAKANPYIVGDILMGYQAYGRENLLTGETPVMNGVDYRVESVAEGVRTIGGNIKAKVYTLRLKNLLSGNMSTAVALSPDNTPEVWNDLAAYQTDLFNQALNSSGNQRVAAWKAFYDLQNEYLLPRDLANENRNLVNKSIDYGYAHTIHKSQGGTYTYAFVDAPSIAVARDQTTREQLRYVALTRASKGTYVLTDKSITENNQRVAEPRKQEQEPAPIPEASASPVVTTPEEIVTGPVTDETIEEVHINADEQSASTDTGTTVSRPVNTTTKTAFPSLLGSVNTKIQNLIHTVFKIPKTPKSNLFGLNMPVRFVADALLDSSSFNAVDVTKRRGNRLKERTADGYDRLLRLVPKIEAQLQKQLDAALDDKSKTKTSLREDIAAGKPVNTYLRARVVNLMREDGTYDPGLVQSGTLALMQWLLNGQQMLGLVDKEDLAKILGTSEEQASSLVNDWNSGTTLTPLIRDLSSKIEAYWGLSRDERGRQGYTDGVLESFAGELVRAAIASGLMTRETKDLRFRDNNDKAIRLTVSFFNPKLDEDITKAVAGFSNAIDLLVLRDPPQPIYHGDDRPPVPNTKVRSQLENTPEEKRGLTTANNTFFRANPFMAEFFSAFEPKHLYRLFEDGEVTDSMNVNHARSVEGKNRMVFAAFGSILNRLAELQAIAGRDEYHNQKFYYPHNIGSNGRMMVQGAFNPQSNKYARAVFLSTWKDVDLTDPVQMDMMYLSVAQALGEKIHKMTREQVRLRMQELLDTKGAPLNQLLTTLLDISNGELSADQAVNEIRARFDEAGKLGDLNPISIHALMEYARSTVIDDRTKFNTSAFIEADGVSNGIVNAMMLLSSGRFTTPWLVNMAKGGLLLNQNITTMNEQNTNTHEGDSEDLYTTGAVNTVKAMGDARSEMGPKAGAHFDDLIELMSMVRTAFFDVKINRDEQGRVTDVIIGRNTMKNPMTITLYGSGVDGIAGNLTEEFVDAIYRGMTDLAEGRSFMGMDNDQMRRFAELLNKMLTNTLLRGKEGYFVAPSKANGMTGNDYGSPRTFTFNDEQLKALQDNFRTGLVEFMRDGITETVGESLINNAEMVRKATQVQSIVFSHKYLDAVKKILAQPGEAPSAFISRDTQSSIRAGLLKYAPIIKAPGQVFDVAPVGRNAYSGVQFGRALDDTMGATAYIQMPGNAGVRGTPLLNIGMGDAATILRLTARDDAPKEGTYIFDGVHYPIASMLADARVTNQAVWEAWQGNTPKAVWNSFNAFMKLLVNADITPEMLPELKRALGYRQDASPSVSELMGRMRALNSMLERSAREVDARKRVLRRVGANIDQMAGAGVPFYNGASFLGSADPSVQEAILNKMLAEELGAAPVPVRQSAPAIAAPKSAHTATVTLVKDRVFQSNHDPIFKDALAYAGNILSGWKIVSGTPEQIESFHEATGTKKVPLKIDGKVVHGVTDTSTNTVYLLNSDAETLVHEVIHAATLKTLKDHYNGNSSAATKEAVKRLEVMMAQFLELSETAIPANAVPAFISMQASVSEAKTPALKLNEFMAWVLANPELRQVATSITVEGKATTIGSYLSKALLAIRRLILGSSDNMLNHLRFNNIVLMTEAEPRFESDIENQTAYMATQQDSDARIADLTESFTGMFANYVNAAADANGKNERRAMHTKMLDATATYAREVSAVFDMTPQAYYLFQNIVATLTSSLIRDPSQITEMNRLYRHVMEKVKYTNFLTHTGDTQNDEYQALQKMKAISGQIFRGQDGVGRSVLMPVFVALSMTSNELRSVLENVPVPGVEKSTASNSADRVVEDLGMKGMQLLSRYYSGSKGTNVREGMDALMNALREQFMDQRYFTEQFGDPVNTALDKGNAQFISIMDSVSDRLIDTTKLMKTRVGKTLVGLVSNVTAHLSQKNHEAAAEGLLMLTNQKDFWLPAREFVSHLAGRTTSNMGVYDLIKMSKTTLQRLRQQFREHVPTQLSKMFTRKLTNEEWQSFHSLAKTGVADLMDTTGESRVKLLSMMGSDAQVNAEIQRLETKLGVADKMHAPVFIDKAKQLARYMNGGPAGRSLLRNARAISHLFNTRFVVLNPENFEKDIDRLVSLYAFQGMDQTAKGHIRNLLREENAGVASVLSQLRAMHEVERSKATGRALNNALKGYIPSLQKEGLSLLVEDDKHFTRLSRKSYVKVGTYRGSSLDPERGSRSYYYAPVSGRAPYNQGLFQNVNVTAGGVDVGNGYTADGLLAGVISSKRDVDFISRNLHRETTEVENLIPVISEDGSVYAYERSLDPKITAMLKKDTNFARMLGVWMGRQKEEELATAFNEQVVGALHDQWMADKSNPLKASAYENLWNTQDPVIKDGLSLLTNEAVAMINATFGGDGFMVRRDQINDALGYRAASVGDAWSGTSRWSDRHQKMVQDLVVGFGGNNAYKYLVNGEQIIQSTVTNVKLIVVVKSVVVPAANMVSNIGQLMVRGVSPVDILKNMPRKLNEIENYVRTLQEKQELELRLRAETNTYSRNNLEAQITSIEDLHKSMSIWPLIQRGEFSSVSDAGISREDLMLTQGKLDEYFSQYVDKLPKGLVNVGKQVLITKDTALFQALQKSVAYGDFVSKAILLDHLTQKKGVSMDEALGRISEEFINYDRLPGRSRGYLESMGLLWFWAYKIGATKIALSIARNNPFQALLASLVPIPSFLGSVDLPTTDNVITKGLDGSLSWSIGPGQGFSGPGLHPIWWIAK